MTKVIRQIKNYFFPPFSSKKNIIQGHKKLKKNKKEKLIRSLKNDLSTLKVIETSSKSSIFELQIRQFLISRLLGISFERALLGYVGSGRKFFLYPLPKPWRSKFYDYNISISPFSGLYYYSYCISWFIYGLVSTLGLFAESLKNSYINPVKKHNHFSFFVNLNDLNFASYQNQSLINNFIDEGFFRDNEIIFHDNKSSIKHTYNGHQIDPLRFPFLLQLSFFDHVEIFLKLSILLFNSVVTAFFGKTQNLLMFKFLSEEIFAEKSFQKKCPNFIFFHNTDYCFKPLWVYSAEKYGSISILYYYSSNIISFDNFDHVGIATMNWKKILVWSNGQKKYLEKALNRNTSFEIRPPIKFFYHKTRKDPRSYFDKNKKNILIFDVQPHRLLALTTLGFENDYYSYQNSKKFINDIVALKNQNNNFNLIIKRKRESILADRRYLNLIKAYSSDNSLIEADTIHAPEDLILYSDIVISMPYTSTGLIAQSQKKPSVFYDSTGMLFDSPYNDLPIISSIKSLEDWVNKVIDSK